MSKRKLEDPKPQDDSPKKKKVESEEVTGASLFGYGYASDEDSGDGDASVVIFETAKPAPQPQPSTYQFPEFQYPATETLTTTFTPLVKDSAPAVGPSRPASYETQAYTAYPEPTDFYPTPAPQPVPAIAPDLTANVDSYPQIHKDFLYKEPQKPQYSTSKPIVKAPPKIIPKKGWSEFKEFDETTVVEIKGNDLRGGIGFSKTELEQQARLEKATLVVNRGVASKRGQLYAIAAEAEQQTLVHQARSAEQKATRRETRAKYGW